MNPLILLWCLYITPISSVSFYIDPGNVEVVSDAVYSLEYIANPNANQERCVDFDFRWIERQPYYGKERVNDVMGQIVNFFTGSSDFPVLWPGVTVKMTPLLSIDESRLLFLKNEDTTKYTCSDQTKWAYLLVKIRYDVRPLGGSTSRQTSSTYCKAYHPSGCVAGRGLPGFFMNTYPTDTYTWFDFTYVKTAPPTTPCAPGTWLTCKDSNDCTYPMPMDSLEWQKYASANRFDSVTGVINFAKDTDNQYIPPVGSCYPCSRSGLTNHYRIAGTLICDIDKTVTIKKVCKPKPAPEQAQTVCALETCQGQVGSISDNFICFGDYLPPISCPPAFAADSTRKQCVCLPGKYNVTHNFCEMCPAGHYCINNIKTLCPDHQYQPQQNQASCIPCNPDFFCTQANQQAVQCLLSNGMDYKRNMGCVPCSQCKNDVLDAQEVKLGLNTSLVTTYKICYPPGVVN